jgi:hypothetical protein
MASRNHASIYGLVATETDATTGFTGTVGNQARASMPLADVAYTINIAFDGSGDAATINLDNGTATGDVPGVQATGTITFTAAPVADETITVNAITYTFKAAATTATQITIGANVTATASNTASKIELNDPAVNAVSVAGVVTISAANTGTYGNAITLTEAATNTSVSGSGTLTGGINKVVITGDGVDALGDAIPTCSAIHGVQVTCTSGSVTATISTIVKDTVSVSNGFQTWSVSGRTDLLENLVITSAAVNTVAKVIVRARD